ncbi:4Fe-4S cluster-binding domain-containing protein [Streptomyces sp. adm13(2018)]|uniref:4Fe-4S cluster-binding domain-containing protein n=1 Tax=Streptomyces sp. adm13(2018) TaxID=2479007 RepID=UPI0021C8A92F|nr:4Fe-4S cluster-binding domain-containing protein [Streptomyces sp. adm13(2018)]
MHSWDLSTGVDGPGTRFVTFLSGCPLTCLYCHNPDTWKMRNGRGALLGPVHRRRRTRHPLRHLPLRLPPHLPLLPQPRHLEDA